MICAKELSKDKRNLFLEAKFKLGRFRLLQFCYLVNPVYQVARHLEYLAGVLEHVELGEIKKLMIFFAPRHGKSELVSCNFPAWFLGRNPDKKIIHASYSESLSNEWSRRTRDIVEDEIYRTIFGVTTEKDVRSIDSWRIQGHRGGMISVGVGGSATGHGADCLPAGTLIETDCGKIKIEACNNETRVLSYNHGQNRSEYKSIIANLKKTVKGFTRIATVSGHSLTASNNHPVFVIGQGYVKIQNIKPGARIRVSEQIKEDTVSAVTSSDEELEVYDIQVADNNNFFAESILVHNCFIIDDPIKNAEEAESEVYRERLYEWYKSVARTRLEPNASIVIMMARWHQKDLAGRILENEKDWTIINLPALAKENDPLGRAPGDALWPERYPKESLLQIKHDIGSRAWASLFDGNPMDLESAIVHRDWIKWYQTLPIENTRFGGIDTATSQKTSSDHTSLVDVCRDWEGYLYIDDVFLEKPSVYTFAQHVSAQHAAKKYSCIKLEKNNAGEAIKQRIDEIGREQKTYPPVESETTTTDKVIRVNEFAHLIENGTIRFKLGNPRVVALVDHLCNFDGKGSDIDDDVDALGFAIKAATGGVVAFSSTADFDVFAKG